MAIDSVFAESVAANALLVGVYVIYKIINRCLTSKCRYTREDGLDFDLGSTPMDAATDMDKIAELLKARSLHHKNNSGENI